MLRSAASSIDRAGIHENDIVTAGSRVRRHQRTPRRAQMQHRLFHSGTTTTLLSTRLRCRFAPPPLPVHLQGED
jgi:hypothetical protein